MLELAKKAFVPEWTMKAVVHLSPFTATAPLSKPRHVVVSSIVQLENRSRAQGLQRVYQTMWYFL